jgi:type IV secretion system protein VirB4
LEPGSRQFLVKQGNSSVVCELDLKGFDFELDVISGRSHNVEIVRELIAEVGDDPAVWLPLFEQRRNAEKTKTNTQPSNEKPKSRVAEYEAI